ncbi:MAG: hypothetical protein CMO35_04460 [Verrucomicrobiaceae bacterium]|jgi:hypothetical protein|nr:hypothetical protein [Verrucomicrobiaceae bacterium]
MKSSKTLSCLTYLSFILAVIAFAPTAPAQTVKKIEASDPTFEDLQSPSVAGNTGKKSWKPKDWLEVEVKVKLEPGRAAPRDGHVDRLTVRWYVAVENKIDKAGQKYFLMEKEVTHVNVPLDEDFYLSCYLSPATIKRLTGSERAGKNSITAVGGEITVVGASAPARFTSQGSVSKPWWQSPTMQRTNKYPLLDKNETPFKFLWWDRYLEIESEPS